MKTYQKCQILWISFICIEVMIVMPIPYFYETDCFNLNRKARLSNATFHWLMEKMMPQTRDRKSYEYHSCDEKKIKCLLRKIHAVRNQIDWAQKLDQASYVVFDTETTGLQPARDKVIEIGSVSIENGTLQRDNTFVELVNPQRPIPGAASHITGITDGMVVEKRLLPEVLHDFMEYTGDSVLVAHSAPFDMAFLNREVGRLAQARILNPVIDTHLLARYLLPWAHDYSLDGLARLFDIEIKGRHTALGDSIMTAELFLKLLGILKQFNVEDLQGLENFLHVQKSIYDP